MVFTVQRTYSTPNSEMNISDFQETMVKVSKIKNHISHEPSSTFSTHHEHWTLKYQTNLDQSQPCPTVSVFGTFFKSSLHLPCLGATS